MTATARTPLAGLPCNCSAQRPCRRQPSRRRGLPALGDVARHQGLEVLAVHLLLVAVPAVRGPAESHHREQSVSLSAGRCRVAWRVAGCAASGPCPSAAPAPQQPPPRRRNVQRGRHEAHVAADAAQRTSSLPCSGTARAHPGGRVRPPRKAHALSVRRLRDGRRRRRAGLAHQCLRQGGEVQVRGAGAQEEHREGQGAVQRRAQPLVHVRLQLQQVAALRRVPAARGARPQRTHVR
eukprot:scaffold434_cov358-Prasinococcus_capsulatus_cf.AAC.26